MCRAKAAVQGRWLAARKARLSLLEKGADSLAEVLASDGDRLKLGLQLELLREVREGGALEQALGHADSARRQGGESGRKPGSALGKSAILDYLQDETPGVRVGSRKAPARAEPFEGSRVAE